MVRGLRRAATRDCTPSPKAYSNLPDGSYTFSVKAKDAAGNEDATPETRSFTVTTPGDGTAPETSIGSGPSGTTADSSPSFGFSSSEPAGATFQCKLDGPGAATGSYADCTPSPKAYSNLPDGSYTFSVKAKDAAGNEDASPATRSFTVDTTAPETTISSGPSGATTDKNPSFGFSSSEPAGATFQCKLDGPGAATGAYADCTPSPKAYSNLPDGSYTFSVKAKDAAGNEDTTPATRSFTIDTSGGGDGGGGGNTGGTGGTGGTGNTGGTGGTGGTTGTGTTPAAKKPVDCKKLKGKARAKCELNRELARKCGKLKGKKKSVCTKRVKALAKCKKLKGKKKSACVRKAKAIKK